MTQWEVDAIPTYSALGSDTRIREGWEPFAVSDGNVYLRRPLPRPDAPRDAAVSGLLVLFVFGALVALGVVGII